MLWFQRTRRGAPTVTPPPAVTSIAAFTPVLEPAKGYVARLFVGDRNNPTASIQFGRNTNGVYLSEGGLVSRLAERTMLLTGNSYRFDGERLLGSSQPNVQLDLKYQVFDDINKISVLQKQITRFFEDARRYSEDGRGEAVWLEHRWYDNLDELPPPVWGQMSQYRKLIMGHIPEYPELALIEVPAKFLGDVVANLITEPFGEGIPLRAGQAVGNVQMVPEGIFVGSPVLNDLDNPDFTATTFDDNWTATSGLIVQQSTDIYRSGQSAARLINNTGAAKNFTQTPASTSSGEAFFSCFIYSESGLDADSLLILDDEETGTAQVMDLGGNWYWAWRKVFLPTTGAYGIRLEAGEVYVVDNFLLTTGPTPVPLFDTDWHNITQEGQVRFEDFGDRLSGQFTISGWITLYYDNPNGDLGYTPRTILSYDSGSDYLRCRLYPGVGLVGVEKGVVGDQSYSDVENFTLPPFDTGASLHICLVQDDTTLTLYINATSIGSLTIPGFMAGDGDLYLGSRAGSYGQALYPLNGALDGWKIWDIPFSAAQVTQLYNNELPVKQDVLQIGPPPVWWTANANNSISPNLKYQLRSHDYDFNTVTQYHNWGVLMGVGGDAEAKTEIEMDRSSAYTGNPGIIRLGRRESAKILKNVGDFFLNFTDSAVSNSEFVDGRGLNRSIATGGSGYWSSAAADPALLQGKHRILSNLYFVTGVSQTVKVRWFYHYGVTLSSDHINGPWQTITDITSGWRTMILDLGDANIQWPIPDRMPASVTVGVEVQNVSGVSPLTVWCDYIQLIPYPLAKILPANGTTIEMDGVNTLILAGPDASLIDANNQEIQRLSRNLAEDIRVINGKYNYVFIMPTQEAGHIGERSDHRQLYKLSFKITPRYGHIGGPG